jgi:tetratricopeptide (TPR) repeat protein
MNHRNWTQVKELFHAALEREPGERLSFLGEACAGDTDLLAQVQSLIASDEEAGDFIARPAFVFPDRVLSETEEEPPARLGQRIGSYEVTRELGRGNMLTQMGDVNGTLESYQKELAICQNLADADPANAQLRSELSSPFERLGETLARLGQPRRALAYHLKALRLREELAAADASNVWKRWDVIESSSRTAHLLAVLGNGEAALEACRKTETLIEATPDFRQEIFFRRYRATAFAERGGAYAAALVI